ncbi:DUF5615 family PIN-like protein [Uliginosibacterium sp. H1]|uniref:DUF5615 family PIN-like protein n=1 Tax=Uliginosibacterium sp. H1 TaxID=3114757 RepID=UPI002E198FA0|nr:DUF5615 family PIN-like protein [Uliginosibacterium sp. H1]
MIFWIDAQLPPGLAAWLSGHFNVEAHALRDLGLRDADDLTIFQQAKAANAVLISKDSDFVELVSRLGPPPKLIWVTCGNVTNQRLRTVFTSVFETARRLLNDGRDIVEAGDEEHK